MELRAGIKLSFVTGPSFFCVQGSALYAGRKKGLVSPLSVIDSNTVLSSTSPAKAKNLNREALRPKKYTVDSAHSSPAH